jgi:hypothetical protein
LDGTFLDTEIIKHAIWGCLCEISIQVYGGACGLRERQGRMKEGCGGEGEKIWNNGN